ncbi:Zinc finger, CCHC-type superfamily [Sesbania bispinosa]|nr:Zinc finger, CCHC-type superfamily [Sesbania bispinosa]
MTKAEMNHNDNEQPKNLESNDEGLVHTDEQGGQQSYQQAECLKKINELTDYEIRALEFDSEYHAYEFYSEYAKVIGFVVRKGEVYRDRNDAITMRQLVCNRQGERCEKHLNRTDRVREAKPITRTKCNARIHVHLNYKTRKWRVGLFEPAHNDELTPANMVHLLPAYRGLSFADKAQRFEDLWNNVIVKMDLAIINGLERKEIEKVAALNVIKRSEFAAACNRLNKAAHINPYNLLRNIEAIHKLADQMERQKGDDIRIDDISKVVRDPTVVKTKGAPRKTKKMKKRRKCSYCKRPGHTVRTCPKFSKRDQLETVVEEDSSVETDEESRDGTGSVDIASSKHANHVTLSLDGPFKVCTHEKEKKLCETVKLTQKSVNEKSHYYKSCNYRRNLEMEIFPSLIETELETEYPRQRRKPKGASSSSSSYMTFHSPKDTMFCYWTLIYKMGHSRIILEHTISLREVVAIKQYHIKSMTNGRTPVRRSNRKRARRTKADAASSMESFDGEIISTLVVKKKTP